MAGRDDDHPVSWLLIRFGWKVLSADGEQIGRVWHVKAERSRDIFNGLTYVAGFSLPRYVPADPRPRLRRPCRSISPRRMSTAC